MAHLTSDPPLYEIVRGRRAEIRELGAYATLHRSHFGMELFGYVRDQDLGWALTNVLYAMDETLEECRRPAIAWVSLERWPMNWGLTNKEKWQVVPDLAVEMVLSEDSYQFVTARVSEFFGFGVRQVWLVDARRRTVHVYEGPQHYRVVTASEVLGDTVIPGFCRVLSELFHPH